MRLLVNILIAALILLTVSCGDSDDAKKGAARPSNSAAAGSGPAGSGASNANESIPGTNGTLGQKQVEKPAATDSTPAKINAAQLFSEQKCVTCHGEDGKGKVKDAPNFTDAAWQRKEKDSELIEIVKQGKTPKMPAFGAKLKDEEIKALIAYIRSFAKK